ncbi:hypothetical protein [Kaistia terrae]|uniref:DUF2474 domain-containing protein n=1 Tax=Kaistia terrae TaxID=537017 RepID=A0ABW0Q2Q2_9HYPH|nr:hypothetical protein [Kaistia terrae]MCX5581346.1 hypothetical protein [Kaistia terrae]
MGASDHPATDARRDHLWRVIGVIALWLTGSAALLLTGAKIISTTIEWIKS